MRLNWFSPLPPQRTDIAHYTMRLAAELMACFEVTFWTDLDFDAAAMPPGADIRTFGPGGLSDRSLRVATADGINIYNLGNDARYHAQIAEVASSVPGIPIFHDLRLHHLVYERSRHDPVSFARYIRDAGELYGTLARIRAEEVVAKDGATIDQFVERAPFTELFVRNAIAAICHSKWAQAQLQSFGLPTVLLQLPFDPPGVGAAPQREWRRPWQLVAYGYMGSNRRVESILEALSEQRFRSNFHFDIYGSLWNEGLIKAVVRERGLESCVTLHGFVSEDELNEAISSAHLTFHLRHPTMGETSGGILRSWALAAPTIVTAEGWFAALPEDVTFKIPVEGEVDHVRRILGELAEQPDRFRAKGEAGLRYLIDHHGSRAYATGLRYSLSDVSKWKTRRIKAAARANHEKTVADHRAAVQEALARRAEVLIDSLWK